MTRGSARKAALLIASGLTQPEKLCKALEVSPADLVRLLQTPTVTAARGDLDRARALLAGGAAAPPAPDVLQWHGLAPPAAGQLATFNVRRGVEHVRDAYETTHFPDRTVAFLLHWVATAITDAAEELPPEEAARISPTQLIAHALARGAGATPGRSATFPPPDPPGRPGWCCNEATRTYLNAAPPQAT